MVSEGAGRKKKIVPNPDPSASISLNVNTGSRCSQLAVCCLYVIVWFFGPRPRAQPTPSSIYRTVTDSNILSPRSVVNVNQADAEGSQGERITSEQGVLAVYSIPDFYHTFLISHQRLPQLPHAVLRARSAVIRRVFPCETSGIQADARDNQKQYSPEKSIGMECCTQGGS